MADQASKDPRQARPNRRTAVLLGLVALAFYIGFMALGVLRA